MITRRLYPTRFALLPSSRHVFDQPRGHKELTGRVVVDQTLDTGLRVVVANLGIIGFDFAGTSLGPFEQLQMVGFGEVPDAVTENRDALLTLQIARMRLAVFVSACIFGHHAQQTNSAILGARYLGLDEIAGWTTAGDPPQLVVPAAEGHYMQLVLRQRAELTAEGVWRASIPATHVIEGLHMADRIVRASGQNAVADFPSLIGMTYQAAVLHQRQHAGASIALSALVLEVLTEELFHIAGLTGAAPRLSSKVVHTSLAVSKAQLKKLRQKERIEHLEVGGLLKPYLAERMNEVREVRNTLMHQGQDATPPQSGRALTAVRDLMQLCTDEAFEINTPWRQRV